MKLNRLAILVTAVACVITACDAKSEKVKADDKASAQVSSNNEAANASQNDVSYMLGYRFGQSLLQTGIKTFDAKDITAGINDALAAKESKLTKEQLVAAATTLNAEIKAVEEAEAKAYIEEGKKFLADNAKRSGVITTKSGLQYEIVNPGKKNGAKPKMTDVVKVHYEGKLINGKVFDSSFKRGEPAEFVVNSVIPGWTEALQLMTVGEQIKLYVPSDLAYGINGIQPVIPANSVLVFDVELLDINPAPAKDVKKK